MILTLAVLVATVLSQAAPPTDAPASPPPQRVNPTRPSAPERTTNAPAPGLRQAPAAPRRPTPPPTAPEPGTEPAVDEDGSVDSLPPLQAEPPVLDFGFIAPRAKAPGVFKLWNRGTKPLRITAVQPSCKCTTTNDVTESDIAPGAFVELKAEFEAANAPQPRKATIKVLVDGYQRVLELEMRGEVAYPLRAVPGYLNVVEGQNKQGRFVVESTNKMPFRICNIHGEKPDYINFDPATDEPRSSYLVRWDVTKFGSKLPGHMVIETDRAECPILPVRIRHESTIPRPVFRLKEYSINLGRFDPTQSVDTEIIMEDPGEPILTVAANSESVRAEMTSSELIDGQLHLKVRITPKADFEGLLSFPLIIYSPTREMPVDTFGVVRSANAPCNAS